MNTKFVAPAVGLLLLGGSSLALAGGWDDHHRGPEARPFHHDDWGHAERHWDAYRDYRWYRPAPRAYVPAPQHVHPYAPAYGPYSWGPHPYNQDGVTIILKGRLN